MSGHSIQLIVGLANPGKAYEQTRHNAGAWFVENIASSTNSSLKLEKRFHGFYQKILLHNKTIHLLIPTTFMNLSGQAVRACMNFHKIPPESILIAHDEIDLPPGAIKLKFDGGNGGHNGLKDIIQHLGTKQFYRLRIGVGHPGNSKDVSDYVLHPPSKADKIKIDDAMQKAQDVLPDILCGDMQKAMQHMHTA